MPTSRANAHASARPAVVAPPCSVFRRHLKRVGLKYTTERADILDAVTGSDRPFEVEWLLKSLGDRNHRVSKATVYRTLKLLVDAGILAERPDARDCVRYELIHGRPPANVELRLPDGTRTTLHDSRIDALVGEICRSHGSAPERHVLIVECTRHGAPR
jgi:Fur family ferric uptake transcriptional regulator